MAKRGAQSTLNHLNWNEAEDSEEAGEFAKASEDVLKQRVIKKARRRVDADADSTATATSTVFGGFKGFASTPLAKTDDKAGGTKSFSFLASLGANANGNGATGVSSSGAVGSSSSLTPMFSFGSNVGAIANPDTAKKTFSFGSATSLKADSTDDSKKPPTASGISSRKESNADTAKLPVSFGTNPAKSSTISNTEAKPESNVSNQEKKSFTFGSAAETKDTGPSNTKSTFSFGSIVAKSDTTTTGGTKSTFSFGSVAQKSDSTNAAQPKTTFSFGSIPPKSDSTESGSALAAKDITNSAIKGTFSFGTAPAKSDSTDSALPKSTFSFGSTFPKPTDSTESGTDATTKNTTTFSFGAIPATSNSTGAKLAKSTFSFGSMPPKNDSTETVKDTATSDTKSTFSFGTVPAKSDSPKVGNLKRTFIFGSVPPMKDSIETGGKKMSFGSSPAKENDKSFSFGVPPTSKEGVKESAEDTVKKMFSFAVPAPKVDTGKAPSKKSVSFGTLSPQKDASVADSAISTSSDADKESFAGSGSVAKMPSTSAEANKESPSVEQPAMPSSVTEAKKNFEKKVISLNKSFVNWISRNVEATPFCKLHIVFRNYEQHFADLEAEKSMAAVSPQPANEKKREPEKPTVKTSEKEKEVEKEKNSTNEKEKTTDKPSFSFAVPAKTSPAPVPSTAATFGDAKTFSFGSSTGGIASLASAAKPATVGFGSPLSSVSTSSPSFFAGASTFGSKSPISGTNNLFGSSTTAGFTFGGVVKPTAGNERDGEAVEGDEDEPPKVEFTPVEEKDSLYSKRCKLFVKAGGSFSDRGIGTLHVKKVDDKVQVLVRAETSLGNILLNIILNETVPLQRMGKNNVMMVCLPTPDSKPPPTSVLLRVKTAEDADELHETLQKYKPK